MDKELQELIQEISLAVSKIFTQRAEVCENIAKGSALRFVINEQKGEDVIAKNRYVESRIWIEANDILKNQLHKIFMEHKKDKGENQ